MKDMKLSFLFLFICSLITGCSTPELKHFDNKKSMVARITYYNAHEDKYGSRIACSIKLRAKEGITIAAHPNFNFYKKVNIPQLKGVVGNGNFIVQDRGSAVTSKKAAHGKAYVFDVFLNRSKREMKKLAARMPAYMQVKIE